MSSRPRLSPGIAIGIISLAAVIAVVAWMNWALKRQKQLLTQIYATELAEALEAYYSEFHRLPDTGQEGDELLTEGEHGTTLLLLLLNKDQDGKDRSTGHHPRFLDVGERKDRNMGGLLYRNGSEGLIPTGMYDAWGRPFHILFDTGHKGELPDPLKSGSVIRGKPVIVYSYGKDGKPGGGDDIKSW